MTTEPARSLESLGSTPERLAAFSPFLGRGDVLGRVVSSGGTLVAATDEGDVTVVVQRRFRRGVTSRVELPTVGDWLALEPLAGAPGSAAVRAVMPRSGRIVRMRLSDGLPQILAANVDTAFLVSGLDHDLNLHRIERYLVVAREGAVKPIVVLNKADVATDLPAVIDAVRELTGDAPILSVSAQTGAGLEALRAHITPASTAVLLGSSGVGKSTITNALLGERRQEVRALRENDSRGRHTTVHRELFVLEGGGLIIDTPGLRTVGVTEGAEGLDATFGDISEFAAACRFGDCRHDTEPGCAVRDAIEAGFLPAERLASQRRLEAEREAAAVRADAHAKRISDRERSRVYRETLRARKKHRGSG